MLQIIRSNVVEALLERLADRVSASPPDSPFTPEVVIVPSPAMARWVNLQLALRHGVAANLEYPLPAAYVWHISRAVLENVPEKDPLALEVMAWRVFAALPSLLQEPACTPLRQYLQEDIDGLRRWQLSSRIAEVFDRYQLYRPELIREWTRGGAGDWQSLLWRRLAAGAAGGHRVAVIDRLLATVGLSGPASALPDRISLFAISSLPPLFVEVFHALAVHSDVDLYVHTPTDAFWADLVSQKRMARKRLEAPEQADLWEVGNSLLASWGRQGQALQDLLLAREAPIREIDAYEEPSPETLLGRLRHDVFALRPPAGCDERVEVAPDASVQVHVCHTAQRECQVLHDELLGMLDSDPDLRPEDILVMVPEISLYAPYVEAVFDRERECTRPYIPWNLSDISVKDEHPLVLIFLQLLDLPASRFTHSEVLSYLDVPELAQRFGLDGEAVAQVKAWLADSNLRWGLDGEHKQRLGLPAAEENTWAQAGKRLFGGYALGASGLFDGIAPVAGVEGARAEWLGRFWHLFSSLAEASVRLAAPRTATQWQSCIGDLLEDFFCERDDEDGRVQKIRDAAADLSEQADGLDETLPRALVRDWLTTRLGMESRRGRYFSGGVTVCGMRPMRSLPFQVICVLGLHDQAFPRRDRPTDFDLMRRTWRPGDARGGDEDRYLFLETLLCARRCLYLSYVGRDNRTNADRQPSPLLRELLDYIDQQYRPSGDAASSMSQRLTTAHPLQPFSPRNFRRGAGGYDDYWCDVAVLMQAPRGERAAVALGWKDAELPEAPESGREVAFARLERFLRHPVRYFVNSRLQLRLSEEEPEADDELFFLDPLQSFGLKQRLVGDHLRGRPPSRRQLSAEGVLPHEVFAELVFQEQREKINPLLERLEAYRERTPTQVPIDLIWGADAAPFRLTGLLGGIYPGLGLLRWRAGSLRGPDILGLWLAHLAWCAADGSGEKRSALYTPDEGFVIGTTLGPDAARSVLGRYLTWYREGVLRPLPLLPRASYAFALKRELGGGDPVKAARGAWNGSSFVGVPGDKDDPYVRLVMRGVAGDPIEREDFATLAGACYGEVLHCGEAT